MSNRISSVGKMKINTVGAATVAEIGDSKQLTPINYTIAVQRERAVFLEQEFDFVDYSVFTRPLLQPIVDEYVQMTRIQRCPYIVVQDINLFITSSSSIVHIGSSEQLNSQSRIKHIRHLLREEPTS